MTDTAARTVLIALAVALAPAAQAADLCAADEVPHFACLSGKRQIALCGSKPLGAEQGWLEFRFLDAKGRTQVFPKARRPARGVFSKDFKLWGREGFEATVHFQVGDLDHVLYANLMTGSVESMAGDRTGIYGYHAGLRLYRGTGLVEDVECDRSDPPAVDPLQLDESLPGFLDVSRSRP